jgi:hypothetical protein
MTPSSQGLEPVHYSGRFKHPFDTKRPLIDDGGGVSNTAEVVGIVVA